jgi:hypothetical protein
MQKNYVKNSQFNPLNHSGYSTVMAAEWGGSLILDCAYKK